MKLYGVKVSRSMSRRSQKVLTSLKCLRSENVHLVDERVAELMEQIRSRTLGMNSEQALRMMAGLDKEPRCACGKTVVTKFKGGRSGGPQTCDSMRKCAEALAYVRAKEARTNLRRYGHVNPFGNDAIKARIRRTNKQRYGGQPANDPRVRAKMKRTNMTRYGGAAPACSRRVRARMEATNAKRRGVTNAFQCERAMAKAVRTSLHRYGTERPCQSAEIKARIMQGFLDKYGATNVFGSKTGKKLVRAGMLAKYGVEHALQHPEIHLQQQRSAYRFRRHRFGDRVVETQGFERYALLWLLRHGVRPKRVRVSMDCRRYRISTGARSDGITQT